jgi:hypothetical protein
MPFVIEYNKRDLDDRLPLSDLHAALNKDGLYPSFETVALRGEGTFETFTEMVRRLVARAHREFDLERHGIRRHHLAAALDQALTELHGSFKGEARGAADRRSLRRFRRRSRCAEIAARRSDRRQRCRCRWIRPRCRSSS